MFEGVCRWRRPARRGLAPVRLTGEAMSSNSEAVLLGRVRDRGPGRDHHRTSGERMVHNASSSSARPTCPLSTRTTCSCSGSTGPPVGDNVVKVPLHRPPWFESTSATMVEMKQRVSGPTEAATRGSRKQRVRAHCEYSDHPEHPFGKDDQKGTRH